MSIKSTHPAYTQHLEKWDLGLDSYEGEESIKKEGIKYLPSTSGQREDGQGTNSNTAGQQAYDAYKLRSVYPSIFKDAVEAAIGIMHKEPPLIELPEALEDMRENCTYLNESLEMLLRKINTRQLTTGRLGLVGDISKSDKLEKGFKPVILIYTEKTIINWNDSNALNADADSTFVVMDETDYILNESLEWELKEQYRILALVDEEGKFDPNGFYGSVLLEENDEIAMADYEFPELQGKKLEEIPFVFVNSKDLSPDPDNPPLDGLARMCIAIYRAEADYRQTLFMQGQDTLVIVGRQGGDEDETLRTGAGARLELPMGGSAEYIGISSDGLAEQREALENDYSRAVQKSGQLLDATSRAKESGDALRIRVAAQTATLPQIAKTGAKALEHILKMFARWHGADEEQVVVTPNLNFTEAELNGETLLNIVQAKGLGAPISEESIHEWMQDQGFTGKAYEDELKLIDKEEPLVLPTLTSPVDKEEKVDPDANNE